MAQEAWRAYLELAIGATDVTRKKATKAVRRLVGKSALSADQLQGMAEDLLRTSAASREAMTSLVRSELEKGLTRVGLATADEVATLQAKIADLEQKLQDRTADELGAIDSADGPPVGAEVVARPPAKKVVAKKTVAKKAVAAKKVPAAKVATPVFVPPPDPAGAEPLAPPAAKKAPVRKAPVRKATVAKTAAAKTTAAKTTAAKTTAAKTTAAKTTVAKPSFVRVAKKAAVKKTSP
jgi:polyhydroxyalkanoate synthesis regulator phasin